MEKMAREERRRAADVAAVAQTRSGGAPARTPMSLASDTSGVSVATAREGRRRDAVAEVSEDGEGREEARCRGGDLGTYTRGRRQQCSGAEAVEAAPLTCGPAREQ
jgi:hypothetical protein